MKKILYISVLAILIPLIVNSQTFQLIEVQIDNDNNSFIPADITINVGDTVKWIPVGNIRTDMVDGETWFLPNNPPNGPLCGFGNGPSCGNEYRWVPHYNGVYEYENRHRFQMNGTITVEGPDWPEFINKPYPLFNDISCEDFFNDIPDVLVFEYTNHQTGPYEISGSIEVERLPVYDIGGCQIKTIFEGIYTDPYGRTIYDHVVFFILLDSVSWVNPPLDTFLTCVEAQSFVIPDLEFSNYGSDSCLVQGFKSPEIIGNLNDCPGTVEVIWALDQSDIDLFGWCQFPTHSMTITVGIPPIAQWIDPPSNDTISCEEAFNYEAGFLSFSNFQSGDNEISGSVQGIAIEDFDECGGEIEVYWYFIDQYDREIEHMQLLTVLPTPMAEFLNPPQDTTISCEEAQSFSIPVLEYSNGEFDNCEINGEVEGVLFGSLTDCDSIVEVTYSFTDSCGRTIEFIWVITIEEDDPIAFMSVGIQEIRVNDSLGLPVLNDEAVVTNGVVHGSNFSTTGLEFFLLDRENNGVVISFPDSTIEYNVHQGDSLEVKGIVGSKDGLIVIHLMELKKLTSDADLVMPKKVEVLNEDSEGSLIILENVSLLNPEDWPESGRGAELMVENEFGVFIVVIYKMIELGTEPPTGLFHLTGLGSQYSTGMPYDDGYFIIPRSGEDFTAINDGDGYLLVSIPDLRVNDSLGAPDLFGQKVETSAIVYGINLRPNGLEFTIIDEDNIGVGVFNSNNSLGYDVQEGDEIRVWGEVGQFRGLTQIVADSIELISTDNDLVEARLVSDLDEGTESSLVFLVGVTLDNPEDWPTPGSAANLTVSNEEGTYTVRVAAAVNLGFTPPQGTFDLTGIGGQFTTSVPADDGYRILPRYAEDLGLDISDPYTEVSMPQLRENDSNGRPVLLGQPVSVTAVVYGINFRPQGLQFTLIDEDNVGVGVFRATGNLGYEVMEGDLIVVKGIVEEFRGLTQINPDEIELISQDNELVEPRVVSALSEETESSLIKLENLTILNPEDWPTPGSAANINVENQFGTFLWRIQAANDLWTTPPTSFDLIGIGAQFTTAVPADGGYQIIARYADDIRDISSVENLVHTLDVKVYPVPASDYLFIEAEEVINSVRMYDMSGKLLKEIKTNSNRLTLELTDLISGNYLLEISGKEGSAVKNVVVK